MTDTTTEEVVENTGVEETQPVEDTQTEAGTPAPEVAEEVEKTEPVETDNPEFNASEWLQKKGIDPTDPDAPAKLARMNFESERQMHKATGEASELKRSMEGQPVGEASKDPLVQQLYENQVAMNRDLQIERFRRTSGITPSQEASMAAYLGDNVQVKALLNEGYLTYDQVYAMSGANQVDPGVVKAQARQDTLQQLANKQRATAVQGSSRQPGVEKEPEDPVLAVWRSDD